MTLVVETGAGLANGESYVSAADCEVYATAHGATFDATNAGAESALRRATQFIDTFRSRFPGFRAFQRIQALEWPRSGAYYRQNQSGINDYQGFYDTSYQYVPLSNYIAPNIIPIEIVRATCEAAIRELASPGTMMPDLIRGGALKRQSAGGSSREYSPGANPRTTFLAIDNLLADLIVSGSFGIAVRG